MELQGTYCGYGPVCLAPFCYKLTALGDDEYMTTGITCCCCICPVPSQAQLYRVDGVRGSTNTFEPDPEWIKWNQATGILAKGPCCTQKHYFVSDRCECSEEKALSCRVC